MAYAGQKSRERIMCPVPGCSQLLKSFELPRHLTIALRKGLCDKAMLEGHGLDICGACSRVVRGGKSKHQCTSPPSRVTQVNGHIDLDPPTVSVTSTTLSSLSQVESVDSLPVVQISEPLSSPRDDQESVSFEDFRFVSFNSLSPKKLMRDGYAVHVATALCHFLNLAMNPGSEDISLHAHLLSFVLSAPRRGGGRRFATKNLQDLQHRVELYTQGKHRSLVNSVTPNTSAPRGEKSTLKSIRPLVAEGRFGDAVKRLSASGLVPCNENTVRLLEAKHPFSETPLSRGCDVSIPDLLCDYEDRVSESLVLRKLNEFSKGTATGPSRISADLLKSLMKSPPARLILLPCLTSFVCFLLRGGALDLHSTRSFITSARLLALPKGPSDVRPIAIGETLRRLTAKIGLTLISKEVEDFLIQGKQTGVGVARATEGLGHVIRRLIEEKETEECDKFVLKTDFTNAFNCIDRVTFIQMIRTHFPDLLPWVLTCYRNESVLEFHDSKIRSTTGAQQGDPLSPFLFCLVVHKLLEELKEIPDLAHITQAWYIDDSAIFGDLKSLNRFMAEVVSRGPQYGLYPNAEKFELIYQGNQKPLESDEEKELFPTLAAIRPSHVIRYSDATILGAPCGRSEEVRAWLERKRADAQTVMESVTDLGDIQIGLLLFRKCLGSAQISHVGRMVPPSHLWEHAAWWDHGVRDDFQAITGVTLETEYAKSLTFLPVREGGFGVKSFQLSLTSAYISASLAADSLCQRLLGRVIPDLHLQGAIELYNSQVLPDQITQENTLRARPLSQRQLSVPASVAYSKQILSAVSDAREISTHLHYTNPHSMVWLEALPIPGQGTVLNNEVVRFAIRTRANLNVSRQTECPAPHCSKQMDALGDHSVNCKWAGDLTKTHNQVMHFVAESLRRAGYPDVETEPRDYLLETDRDHSISDKRADVFCSFFDGEATLFDVTGISPQQQKTITKSAREMRPVALEEAEAAKTKHYAKLEPVAPITSIKTLAFTHLGGISEDFDRFLSKVTMQMAQVTHEPLSLLGRQLRARLSALILNGRFSANSRRQVGPQILHRKTKTVYNVAGFRRYQIDQLVASSPSC